MCEYNWSYFTETLTKVIDEQNNLMKTIELVSVSLLWL